MWRRKVTFLIKKEQIDKIYLNNSTNYFSLITPFCVFLALLMTMACGGGSSDPTSSDNPTDPVNTDIIKPTVSVTFPPAETLTDRFNLQVVGTANDNIKVKQVVVNGQVASSENEFLNWSTSVDLSEGHNQLQIEVSDYAGNIDSTIISVTNSPLFGPIDALAYDTAQQVAYAVSKDNNALYSIDLVNGKRQTVLQDISRLNSPIDIAINAQDNSAIVFTYNNFVEINLQTAELQLLPNVNNSEYNFTFFEDFILDSVNNRLFVVDVISGKIYATDLASGQRSLIFDMAATSLNIGTITGFAYQSALNTLYLSEFQFNPEQSHLVAVNLTTNSADRIIEDIKKPSAVNRSFISDLQFDANHNRLILTEKSSGDLLAVKLTDLSISVISSNEEFFGNQPSKPQALSNISTDNKVLLSDQSQEGLSIVNLVSGVRTNVKSIKIPQNDIAFIAPADFVIDDANQRALVIDQQQGILAVSLLTGQKILISDIHNAGQGAMLNTPEDIELDKMNNRVMILDSGRRAIIAVDLSSGMREIIYDGANVQSLLSHPSGADYDFTNNIAYIVDHKNQSIVEVNLSNGEQVLIAKDQNQQVWGDSQDIVFNPTKNELLVTGFAGVAYTIVHLSDNSVEHFGETDKPYSDLAIDSTHNQIFMVGESSRVVAIPYNASTSEDFDSTLFIEARAIEVDTEGEKIYVLDKYLHALYIIDYNTREGVIFSN
ncbi:hypothetical protein [Aliikangiella maris]|uniref:Uncharacterized protein n=2 Tax=Aliikangiella maris TaxID=3162458 RepID=A0ABV3MP82_9GAMM